MQIHKMKGENKLIDEFNEKNSTIIVKKKVPQFMWDKSDYKISAILYTQ